MSKASSGPEPQVLLSGLAYVESPRWHDGRLWFAHWGTGEIVAVDLDGNSEVVGHGPPALGWSIDWLPDGRLLVTGQELLRREPDGSMVRHADLSGVAEHGWNEIAVDGRGNAYVNCVGYDMMGGEQPTTGIIGLVTAGGAAPRQVADEIAFPNGMAITPDGSTLIVAESHAGRLTAFDIDPDGGLSRRRVWADLGDAAPDGICLDTAGAAWYADVPNQRCVRVAEGGQVLQTITLDRGCFSCALGGPDGRTLFMTAAQWAGPDGVGSPTGLLLTAAAPEPGI
jgi:sugar lactone lactonase YvrE